ncbi:mannitol-specific cryptic PTS system IIIA component [Escherichia coli]|uniref:Mannitol-specific cryptic PTS system IIIA component n=1 Tax=Escherichia coli TaxID=562 RepID=A0A376TST5_ECOLX|nr:mannitol-specific cryptic PTS system IIIA component [Escherichia coli]
MRLSDYFPESSISVIHSAKDWQEAIDFSMVSLLDKNYISENYIQAIKDSTINNGPYYILHQAWQCLMRDRNVGA